MAYSNLIATYLGNGLLSARPASPAVPGIAYYFATDAGALYLWNGAAWSVADTRGEVSYSADHVVLASEDGITIYVDASAAARIVTVPRTLGATTRHFVIKVARDPSDATSNNITVMDCVSAVSTTPVNFIDAITSAVNGGQIPTLEIHVNGSRVTSPRSAA